MTLPSLLAARHRRARLLVFLTLVTLAACGGRPSTVTGTSNGGPSVAANAADVRSCLQREGPSGKWDDISSLSDFGARTYGIDFTTNSVQIYIEKDAASVAREADSIRKAEDQMKQTAPSQRVILHSGGNVLVSWANQPTATQLALVKDCAGIG